MSRDKTTEVTKRRSPVFVTQLVVYAVMLVAMYFISTPEVTGTLTEGQERDFHVAAVNSTKDANPVAVSLAQLKARTVDLSSTSFLLPEGNIKMNVQGGDLHMVTVLERHPGWQLVEYRYGNTHDSISRYRAFKDHIEPVSYRITMHPGLIFGAVVLLLPAWIVSALINVVWRRVVGRRKTPDVA